MSNPTESTWGYQESDESRNEDRADWAFHALAHFTKLVGNSGDLHTDLSDLVADIFHLCDRAGFSHNELIFRAQRAYEGDMEDGPKAAHDPSLDPIPF